MDKPVKIGLAIMLLLCLASMPMGYYSFVRIAAMVGFGYLAYHSSRHGKESMILLYIILLLLFQPLFPVHFSRSIWNVMDIVAVVILLADLKDKK